MTEKTKGKSTASERPPRPTTHDDREDVSPA